MTPGLTVIHANHAEDLREMAVEWVSRHPLRPLENELFLVHSNGMAQWLKLRLAQSDACGISASIQTVMPSRFAWTVYRAVLDAGEVPVESPYDKQQLVWRLMALLPDCRQRPGFEAITRFLGEGDPQRRYQLAVRLADLFDQYQVYRADWLSAWARGQDVLLDRRGRRSLPPEQAWQAALWRMLCERMPRALAGSSRVDIHQRFLQVTKSLDRAPPGLPRRVMVFGISSMPGQILEVLEALSRHSQVLIFVTNPCRYYWGDIIEDRELLHIDQARHPIKPDLAVNPELMHARSNPLLAAWGKQGRDFIGLLYGCEAARGGDREIDLFRDRVPEAGPASLLEQIQQGILDLDPLPEEPQPVSRQDRSVVFQVACSRQREVEVLHDQLLDRIEAGEGRLQPRDIVVMTPDVDAYAPHIEAVFGLFDHGDARYIPYSVADRPQGAGEALVMALDRLLSLPEARLTAQDVQDLLAVAAFRRRFDIPASDLDQLRDWIAASGIRWGLDAAHRQSFELPAGFDRNTWSFGLARMLLGYAAGDAQPWQDIAPFDEVGGMDGALAGQLAHCISTLDQHRRSLSGNHPPDRWARRLRALLADTLSAADTEDQMLLARFEAVIDGWESACEQAGLDQALPLSVVRQALLEGFGQSGVSQRFLMGAVNFCTLMPMRAVPFKLVCMLGMNDADYPRVHAPMDFDLMADNYRPGDRSRREDDRYLFLEAILSAREQLYISHVGRSNRDSSQRAPSVLVAQLRDHIRSGWRAEEGDGATLLDALTIHHPLQPFSPRYLETGGALFSYAREWWPESTQHAPDSALPLPAHIPDAPVTIRELARFLRCPAELFFERRLGVRFADREQAVADTEPFSLDGLEAYSVRDALVRAAAEDGENAAAVGREMRRQILAGVLPMGAAEALARERLEEEAGLLLDHLRQAHARWPTRSRPLEVALQLSGGTLPLRDWVSGARAAGDAQVLMVLRAGSATTGKGNNRRYKYHYFHPLWLSQLAVCAGGQAVGAVLVATDGVYCLPTIDAAPAMARLEQIAEAYLEGLREPLPTTLATATAWLEDATPAADEAVPQSVQQAYHGAYRRKGELEDCAVLARCWPDADALWGPGFRRWSEALYQPLIDAVGHAEGLS